MEELDLKDLLNYFKRKFIVIILTVILALLIGYTYVEYFQLPMYQGITTIILVENNDNRVSDLITQNEITVNEKLVTTYSEVIKSKRVLNRVINDLKLKNSVEDLIEIIQVSSVQNTSIIKITVEHENGKKAAVIANKIAEIFKEEITQIYNLENVSIIDEAIEEEEPYNVNLPLQFIIYTLIGGISAVAIIFVMYYFNNSISSKQEIESKLNIPVIGEVPSTSILNSKKNKRKNQRQKNKVEKVQEVKKVEDRKKKSKKIAKKSSSNKEQDNKTISKSNIQKKKNNNSKVKKKKGGE